MNLPKNILIVRTDRIGDVVLSLPLASIIKKNFPQTKITFLLREYTKPLAEGNPYIDEIITLVEKDGKPDVKANISNLRAKFDACVVAFPTYPVALILFMSNIPLRIGSGYRWYSFLFNKRIREHRKYGQRHELEYNVRLLRQLGIDYQADESNVQFGIVPSEANEKKIKEQLNSFGIDLNKPVVIVHPGSGGSSIDFPIQKMKMLVGLIAKLDVGILITGSANEKELCNTMVVSNNIINTAGKYGLSELMALINKSDLMIANSTGPIHIAAALGKYVIGFYPKIASCAAKRWGPYTNKKIIFSPTIDCDNCTRSQCERLNCMDSIKTEDVFKQVEILLRKIQTEKAKNV